MKISPAPIRSPFIELGPRGEIVNKAVPAPIWVRWLRQVEDSPLREVTDASNPPTAPTMKAGELIILKATGIAKNYLVYFDGVHRHYWQTTGTDLY